MNLLSSLKLKANEIIFLDDNLFDGYHQKKNTIFIIIFTRKFIL